MKEQSIEFSGAGGISEPWVPPEWEQEIYAKWKKEHGDVMEGTTPHEWYVRNYVDTRLIPFIRDNFISKEKMREEIQKLKIKEGVGNSYYIALSDISRALEL